MQIVIDIDDDLYTRLFDNGVDNYDDAEDMATAIRKGKPLPKGHGRLIDADECIKQAWNDFYKHEDEWEKKDPDYVGVKRFHDQNGFECCLKTICKLLPVIEADKAESDEV